MSVSFIAKLFKFGKDYRNVLTAIYMERFIIWIVFINFRQLFVLTNENVFNKHNIRAGKKCWTFKMTYLYTTH